MCNINKKFDGTYGINLVKDIKRVVSWTIALYVSWSGFLGTVDNPSPRLLILLRTMLQLKCSVYGFVDSLKAQDQENKLQSYKLKTKMY